MTDVKPAKEKKPKSDSEELQKSIEELRDEVKQLRELVNLLVEIIVNMEQDDLPEFDPELFPGDKYSHHNHFTM